MPEWDDLWALLVLWLTVVCQHGAVLYNRNVFHVAGPWDAFRVLVIFWGFCLWQLNLCFSLNDVVVSCCWAAVLTTLQEAGSWWTQSRRAITDSSSSIWITALPSFCHLFSYMWMPHINTKLPCIWQVIPSDVWSGLPVLFVRIHLEPQPPSLVSSTLWVYTCSDVIGQTSSFQDKCLFSLF